MRTSSNRREHDSFAGLSLSRSFSLTPTYSLSHPLTVTISRRPLTPSPVGITTVAVGLRCSAARQSGHRGSQSVIRYTIAIDHFIFTFQPFYVYLCIHYTRSYEYSINFIILHAGDPSVFRRGAFDLWTQRRSGPDGSKIVVFSS